MTRDLTEFVIANKYCCDCELYALESINLLTDTDKHLKLGPAAVFLIM